MLQVLRVLQSSTSIPPIEMVDDLDCSIVGLSTDADGDAITVQLYLVRSQWNQCSNYYRGDNSFGYYSLAQRQQQDCGNV